MAAYGPCSAPARDVTPPLTRCPTWHHLLIPVEVRAHIGPGLWHAIGDQNCVADAVATEGRTMPELMTSAIALVATINRIAVAAGSPIDLVSLWDPLRELLPFSDAWLGVLDGGGRRFLTAAAVGPDVVARQYIESPRYHSDMEAGGILRSRQPIRLRGAGPSAFAAHEGLWPPAERRDGLGIPLIAGDGRPIGLLILLTDATGRLTDTDCRLICALAPMIAAAVDPMTSIAGLAGLVVDAHAAAAVGPDGTVHPLPGSPEHPLLMTGCRTLAVASDHLRAHSSPASFLHPYAAHEVDGYLRITAIACPPLPSSPFDELVIVSPPGDLHGLTRRELEVLGLVIDGSTNRQIASTLFITQRTVAAHLEHIRTKLDAPTRTAAAVVSLNQALYVPPELAGPDS
jgi:DNA-binding CsgD family transcriptional regulator